MAIVRPFRAIRPVPDKAAEVVSLPYDVMNREEAARMAEGKPYSFLHICRSEIDLPDLADPYAPQVYEKARDNIQHYLDEGIFVQDGEPAYYFYRQTMDGNTQTGVVACVSVDEYLDGTIKKHEHTRAEKELDRIRHFDVCNADTEPVFLTYRSGGALEAIVREYTAAHAPEFDLITEDGVGHAFWVLRDSGRAAQIAALFREVPALYIADGHHRSASACKVGQKRREANPGYTGEEEFNYFMAVVFPDRELRIFDYNRVVRDLAGLAPEEFLAAVAKSGFTVEQTGNHPVRPDRKHVFGMDLMGVWYRLTLDPARVPSDPIGSLDVSLLQNLLLDPVLGIKDPRTDKRIDFVGGIRGLEGLEKRVAGDMAVAFSLFPVTIGDLLSVADQGEVMPPKSTWFEPKLGSGLFLHRL